MKEGAGTGPSGRGPQLGVHRGNALHPRPGGGMGKGFLRWPRSRKVGVALPAEAVQAQSRKVSLFLSVC